MEIANQNIDIEVVETGGENTQYFWHNTTDVNGEGAGAHITEMPQDDFVDDPENGGGNTLITSQGVYIRQGTSVSAEFGDDEIVLYTADGVPAFSVNSGSGSTEQKINSNEMVTDNHLVLNQTATGRLYKLDSLDNGDYFTIEVGFGLRVSGGAPLGSSWREEVNFNKADTGSTTYNRTVTNSRGEDLSYTITYTAPDTISITPTSATPSIPSGSYFHMYGEMYYYAIVSDSQVNISSDDELHDALDGISWANLLNNDMLDLRAFIKRLLTHLSNFFWTKSETHNFSSVAANGNMTWTGVTITNPGYYPLGVVGYYSGAATLVVRRAEIENETVGSCTLNFAARNVGSSSVSAGTCNVQILWVKAE